MQSEESQYDQFDQSVMQEEAEQNMRKQLQLQINSQQQHFGKVNSKSYSNKLQKDSKIVINISKCPYQRSELAQTVQKFNKVSPQMLYYYFLLKDLSKQTYFFLFQFEFDFQGLKIQKDAKILKSTSLQKIELKMLMGFYQTPNQFQNDIQLMFNNFMCINHDNKQIIQAAQHMKQQYERRIYNILDYSSQVNQVQYQLEMYRFLNEIQNQQKTRQMKQRDQRMGELITEQDKIQIIEALNNLSPLKKQHLKRQIELNFYDLNLSKGVLFLEDLDGANLIKFLRIAEKYTQYQPRSVDIEQILQKDGIQKQQASSLSKSRENDFQSSFDSNYQSD